MFINQYYYIGNGNERTVTTLQGNLLKCYFSNYLWSRLTFHPVYSVSKENGTNSLRVLKRWIGHETLHQLAAVVRHVTVLLLALAQNREPIRYNLITYPCSRPLHFRPHVSFKNIFWNIVSVLHNNFLIYFAKLSYKRTDV